MHLSEGLLPVRQAAACVVAVAPFVVAGIRAGRGSSAARTGMLTALLFAVTLFPVPVPVVGVTSHMCATPVLALVVGPTRVIVPTLLVLVLQALFFAHGGITTLGANVLTLGIIGPFVAFGVARLARAAGLGPRVAAGVACGLGDLAVYATAACLVGTVVGPPDDLLLNAGRVMAGLAPAQLPLAVLEGLLSAALVGVLVRQPSMRLPVWLTGPRVVGAAALLFVLVGVGRPARAADYLGVDEVVFEAAAKAAGRHPGPWLDLEGTELGRALYGGAMLLAGFAMGVGWAHVRRFGPARGRQGDP